jgi:ABC-type nitrate/sulfonate/bicarbonate transport system substrate-binding protein
VRRAAFAGVLSALLMLGVNIAASAQEPALQTVRLIGLPGIPLPVVVGTSKGIFARFGIEVHAEKAADADALRSTLASHGADIAHSAAENAVVMSDSGQADVVIVLGGETATSELIVQPEIKSVKDLRGRTIIVDGPDTAYSQTLRKILLRNGIKPGVDCEIKVIGLAPQRLQAMQDHQEYAATLQKPPTSILSKRAGLVSLGSTQELLNEGPAQGISGFVDRQWARQHSALLERYIAAFIESQRWLLAPENKQAVIAMLMKESHLAADVAAETYEIAVNHGWTPDARFDLAGFQNTLALQEKADTSAARLQRYYDLSYYQRALAEADSPK